MQVHGRVQGVGFRYHVAQAASARGLTGWVRNRLDGSVELVVQGDGAEIERWRRWLLDGVPTARVDSLRLEPVPHPWETLTGFERRPTV